VGARTLILVTLAACSSAPPKLATPPAIPADAGVDAATADAARVTEDDLPPLVPEPRGKVVVITSDPCGLVLETVHFPAGSAMPAPTSAPVLDGNAAFLVCLETEGQKLVLEVGGHTDDRELDALTLSDSRARVVRSELIRRGVNPAWLVAQGYAASQPRDRAKTAAARAKNRRVELLVLRRN
jgi:outer membrane protein OmpA-like peptidoglycan-associated protein